MRKFSESKQKTSELASKMSVHCLWCHSIIFTDAKTYGSFCKEASRPQRHWKLFQGLRSKLKSGWLEKASPANIKEINMKAKRNFITHWLASWDHGSQNTYETIDTFKNTTAAVKQKFGRKKIKLNQVAVTESHTRKAEISNTSCQVRPFLCPMFKRFAQ